jgi:hypothetical protein
MEAVPEIVPSAAEAIGRCLMYLGWALAGAALVVSSLSAYLMDRANKEWTLQVAAARRDAENANERAGQADERAGEANKHAGQANERAGQANERAGALEVQAAQLKLKAEELHKQNLELQEAVSPINLEQGLTSYALKPYADVAFVVVSLNDYRTDQTAGQIRWMLLEAGWKKYQGPVRVFKPFGEGVLVRSWLPPDGARGDEAKDALVEILKKNGIKVSKGAPIKELGPNVVYIEVGPKPLPEGLQDKSETPRNPHGFSERGNYAAPWPLPP